jgi:hypothetical protein
MSCGAGLAFTFTLVPLFLFRAARPRSYAVCIPRSKARRIFLIIPRDRPNLTGGPGPFGLGLCSIQHPAFLSRRVTRRLTRSNGGGFNGAILAP